METRGYLTTMTLFKKRLTIILSALFVLCMALAGFSAVSASANDGLNAVTLENSYVNEHAEIRLVEPTGMRFTTKIAKSDLAKFDEENVQVVTLITPKAYLDDAGIAYEDFTKDSEVKMSVIPFSLDELIEDGDFYAAKAVLLEVKEQNVAKTFVAKTYITDGEKIGYTNATGASIWSVAIDQVLLNLVDTEDEDAMAVLQKYATVNQFGTNPELLASGKVFAYSQDGGDETEVDFANVPDGSIITLNSGVYESLTLDGVSNVAFFGYDATINAVSVANSTAVKFMGVNFDGAVNLNGVDGIVFSACNFSGSSYILGSNELVKDVIIESCNFINMNELSQQTAIKLPNTTNLTIKNSLFDGIGYNVLQNGATAINGKFVFVGNTVKNCSDRIFRITGKTNGLVCDINDNVFCGPCAKGYIKCDTTLDESVITIEFGTNTWYCVYEVDLNMFEGATINAEEQTVYGHVMSDGACEYCGVACAHEWTDGSCGECGAVCEHAEYANGACKVCGKACEHVWEDGVCGTCSTACEHAEYEDGACKVCGKAEPVVVSDLYFGQHEKFAVDGVVAKMTEGDTLAYEGVKNSNDENNAIIRFQIIQTEGYNGAANYYNPVGAKNIFITIQDANNPLNYVTVLLATIVVNDDAYFSYGAKIGARASVWGEYTTDSKAEVFVGGNKTIGTDTTGWAGYGSGIGSFSFYNEYLENSDTDHMMGIAIKDKTIYMITYSGVTETAIPFALQDLENTTGKVAWPGFDSTATLNVYVTTTGFNGAEYSHLVVDTLGGDAVTSVDGFSIVDNGTSLVPAFEHAHTWNETYTTTTSEHWIECSNVCCFEIKEGTLGAHDMSTGACICGETHTHSWSVVEYTPINHYEKCGCGETQNAESHEFIDGACKCGFKELFFGQTANFTHDGVLARVQEGKALVYEDVALTSENTANVIRFQVLPTAENAKTDDDYGADPNGPSSIMITLQDSEDASNYISVLVRRFPTNEGGYYYHGASVGARASVWGTEYPAASGDEDSFIAKSKNVGLDGGYGFDWGIGSFSMYGYWLSCPTDGLTNVTEKDFTHERFMMGISVIGTKVYINNDNKNREVIDLATVEGKTAWNGFTSDKVNVFVRYERYSANYKDAYVSIDTIGGVATSADSVANFSIVDCGSTYVPAAYLPQA